MQKEDNPDKKLLELLTSYNLRNVISFFSSLGINLPQSFTEELEKGLSNIAEVYSIIPLKQSLKLKLDYLTVRAIDLKKMLGLEKASNLSRQSLEYCFNLISETEPKEIIYGLLKNESNFSFLLHCCFENYLKNLFKKRFDIYNKLSSEKIDILFEKTLTKIFENFGQISQYDDSKASFKTFLGRALLYSAYTVLREEGLEFNYYMINRKILSNFINDKGLDTKLINKLQLEEKITFQSRKDVKVWFKKNIGEEILEKNKLSIWDYVKLKSDYVNIFTSDYDNIENHIIIAPDTNDIVTTEEKQTFINKINSLEKETVFRIIAKLKIGLNVNYLCEDLSKDFDALKLSMTFLRKLNEISSNFQALKNDSVFEELHKLFAPISGKINKIAPTALRQRMYRNYKKLQTHYSSDDFIRVLNYFNSKLDLTFIKEPLKFLMINNEAELDLLKHSSIIENVRVICLHNIGIRTIPDEIFTLAKLQELDLSDNLINKIPKEICNLVNLSILDLRDQYSMNENNNHKSMIVFDKDEISTVKKLLCNCEILYD